MAENKWISGVTTLLIGVLTPFLTGWVIDDTVMITILLYNSNIVSALRLVLVHAHMSQRVYHVHHQRG